MTVILVDVFKIRRWGEAGLHVGSVCCVGSSTGSLVTWDADMASMTGSQQR